MKEHVVFIVVFSICIISILMTAKIYHLKQNGMLSRKGIFKILDRILLVFSVLAIFISLLFDVNFIQYKAPIPHKDWETISLQDFKGLNRPYKTLQGNAEFAFVSTSIHVEKDEHGILIEALFHPSRSYVYNRNLYADKLLSHEMYHFHITEYCARLLRKEVLELLEREKKIDLGKMKEQILLLERKMQREYDDETYHSYVFREQLRWQQKMDSLLVESEKYSNTIIFLGSK